MRGRVVRATRTPMTESMGWVRGEASNRRSRVRPCTRCGIEIEYRGGEVQFCRDCLYTDRRLYREWMSGEGDEEGDEACTT